MKINVFFSSKLTSFLDMYHLFHVSCLLITIIIVIIVATITIITVIIANSSHLRKITVVRARSEARTVENIFS